MKLLKKSTSVKMLNYKRLYYPKTPIKSEVCKSDGENMGKINGF
jgi:hypothetical protein